MQIPSLSLAIKPCQCFHLNVLSRRPGKPGSQPLGVKEQALLGCCVSVVAYSRDLGTRCRSRLCRRVPFVSLSVVCSPWVFWLWEQGRAGSCLPAVCGAGVVCPGWLVVPVSVLLCRFCLSLPLLSIPRGFPPLPRNALSDIGSAPSFFFFFFLVSGAGMAGRFAGLLAALVGPALDVAGRTGQARGAARQGGGDVGGRRGPRGAALAGAWLPPARLAGPAPAAPGFLPFPFPRQSWLGSTDPPAGDVRRPERG